MMPMNSREIRLLKKALSRSRDCATVDELAQLSDGSLEGSAMARVAGHVGSCPRCKTELALLEKFESAAPRPHEEATVNWISTRLESRLASGEEARARPDPWWRKWIAGPALNRAGFALATAMLAIAVATGLGELRAPGISPSSGGETLLRSAGVTGLTPSGDVGEAPSELRWDPVQGAAAYSVRLMEVDRTPVWSADARESRIALPPPVTAQFVHGKPFLWEVTARDEGGVTISTSGVQRVRVNAR